MDMTVEQVESDVPVTILTLRGALDASNYEDVIAKGRELYEAGTRRLVLDMSEVPFMGSSGLVALQCIVLLLQGKQQPDLENGWQAFRDLDNNRGDGVQQYVKLLNPQPKIVRTLEVTGLLNFYETYTDRRSAVASFA